jgi:subfamily B ATP-binding cassette protein MsbA
MSKHTFLTGWLKVARFIVSFRFLWRKALLANIFGALSSALQMIVPLASVVIVNQALPNKDFNLLMKISVVMGLATLIALVTSYLEFYHASVFRERAAMALELRLFGHIQRQPSLFFKTNDTGYVMSRIANDGSAAIEVVSYAATIGRSASWLLGGLILLPYFHTVLGMLILSTVPLYVALILWFNTRTRQAWASVQEKTAVVGRELYESLTGIQATKACTAEKYRERRYAKVLVGRIRALIKGRILTTAGGQVLQIVTLVVSLIILTYGGAAVIADQLSLGALIGMNALAAYLFVPINRLVQQALKMQQSVAALERIDELLAISPEEDDAEAIHPPATRGQIRYEGVSFSYVPGTPVLDNISFEILPGEAILLLGASGVGKTTLVNLLPGFLESATGEIYLDGIPTRKLPRRFLRQKVAFVSQDTFLFSDSIYNNIRMGNLSAGSEEIREAARLANALEFIERLPRKFDTQVGERGTRLSGGQRQRIAIARALVRKAQILVFDEATSAVDPEGEAAVHEALCRLMKDRTTIIIAHHADAFIQYVDRVLLLDEGRISVMPSASLMRPQSRLRVNAGG